MRKMLSYYAGIALLFLSPFLLISAVSMDYASTYTFTAIDFYGATNTYLNGINNVGQILGYDEDVSSNGHGFYG